MKLSVVLFFVLLQTVQTHAQSIYKNELYKFSVEVPNDWVLYGELVNDTVNHRAIVDWGLPTVFSAVENQNIENAITITAYQRSEIESVESLIEYDAERMHTSKTTFEVDPNNPNARIILSEIRGLKYKGKSYYVYKNGTGYVITFMATPGTYEINLNIFEAFHKRIQFM